MPAANVSIQAIFEQMVYTATLEHTNDGAWGKSADNVVSGGLDAAAQCYAYERTNSSYVGGATYIQFTDIPKDIDIGSAILTVSGNQLGSSARDMKVYWLPANPDLTEVSNTASYTATKNQTAKLLNTKNKGEFTNATVEIKDAARAMASTGTLTLYLTENVAFGTFNGKGAESGAPTLTIYRGRPVTFNVTATNGGANINGATIEIKQDTTVVETLTTAEGTASVALVPGEYTYTVTSADYAIKSGSITVENASVTENVSLADNKAKTITVSEPTTGTTVAVGETGQYTAAVKDQDNRDFSTTVTWSIAPKEGTDADDKVTINETTGLVTVAEGAKSGNFTVTATIAGANTTTGEAISDTADLVVSAAAKVNLTVSSGDTENGDVSYTVNSVTAENATTQVLPDAAIVAKAVPKTVLYEFVGWATSAENAASKTYIENAGAEYSFTMGDSDTTLIACFENTGLYAKTSFDSATVEKKTGKNENLITNNTADVGKWYICGSNGSSTEEIKAAAATFTSASGNVFQTYGASQQSYLKFADLAGESVTIGDSDTVKIAFDVYYSHSSADGDTALTIGSSKDSSALYLRETKGGTATSGKTAITPLADGETLADSTLFYYDYATSSYKSTGITVDSELHIEEVINGNGTATVTLKDVTNNKTETINLTSVPLKTLNAIYFDGARVQINNGTVYKGNMNFYVDNVSIYKVTN